jgi:hypothetical protein
VAALCEKELYLDDDCWVDHDVNCHREYKYFIDDDLFGDGFRWTCCD